MTRTYIILLITLIFCSCGQVNSTRKNSTTDPILAPYVTSFERAGRGFNANFSVGDVPVNFGDIEDPNHKGVCITYTDDTKEILIRKEWWNQQSEEFKESLIFHELGHCALGRKHHDEKVTVGSRQHKVSMMNSTILSPSQYSANKDAYLKELFTFEIGDVLSSLGI